MTINSAATTEAPSDRIKCSATLQAPRERVWRAVADAEEFGQWFRANLNGQSFVPGQRTRGHITYPGYEHIFFDVLVEFVEPLQRLGFRWHPYAIDPAVDYSLETPTLVCFTLTDASNSGTQLAVVESGFEQLPSARRDEAWRMNRGGWEAQMDNIRNYIEG